LALFLVETPMEDCLYWCFSMACDQTWHHKPSHCFLFVLVVLS